MKKKLRKMGIDPITHRPLNQQSNHQHGQQDEDKRTENELASPASAALSDTSSSESELSQISTKSSESPPSSVEQVLATIMRDLEEEEAPNQTSPMFCIDDVPMVQPNEILLPSFSSSPPSAACSGSSASLEELWEMEDLSLWDFLSQEEGDEKLVNDPLGELLFDQDDMMFGLL